MNHHDYHEYTGKISFNAPLTDGIFQMQIDQIAPVIAGDSVVDIPHLSFRAGQFFVIEIPGLSLRRAFAPAGYSTNGFSFVYAQVGSGTEILSKLAAGTAVDFIAPLGSGYDLSNLTPGTVAIVIGGGAGAPSLLPLLGELRRRKIKTAAVLGARSQSRMVLTESICENCDDFLMATDDGSAGVKNDAMAAAREFCVQQNYSQIALFVCGPRPMLKAAGLWAISENLPCQVSLEERMGCGIGACMGCVVATDTDDDAKKYRRICHSGPVFNATEIAWNEF